MYILLDAFVFRGNGGCSTNRGEREERRDQPDGTWDKVNGGEGVKTRGGQTLRIINA